MSKEYLKEIYKVESEKYNKTRDIHWKMNIGIWTLLVVAIYAKSDGHLEIEVWQDWQKLILYIGFPLLNLIFILVIHGSLNMSLSRMNDMATKLLMPNYVWSSIGKEKWFYKSIRKVFSWEILQIGITFLLIFIFILVKTPCSS